MTRLFHCYKNVWRFWKENCLKILGLRNDKQYLAAQISRLVDDKLSLNGKLGQCEKELYFKDEELASLRSNMIVLDNSLTERTQTLIDTTNQIVIAEGISIDLNSKLLIANFTRFRLQLQNDEIQQSLHQSATKIAELESQLKKLEAKRIADIADTKQQCQYEYESLLKERATAIAKLNESLKENETDLQRTIKGLGLGVTGSFT
jgi:chromosome segregation ATPase